MSCLFLGNSQTHLNFRLKCRKFTSMINLELLIGSCDTASSRMIVLTPVLFIIYANCFSQLFFHGFHMRPSRTGHPPKSRSNVRIDEAPVTSSSSKYSANAFSQNFFLNKNSQLNLSYITYTLQIYSVYGSHSF